MADFKGKKGHWVTTESGSHIFIESGKSFDDAVSDAFGKENAKKYKKADDYDYDKPYSSLYGFMDNPDDYTDVDGTKIKKSDLDKMDIQYGKSKADPEAYDRLEGIPDVEDEDKTDLIKSIVGQMTENGTKDVNLNAGTIARASGGKLTEDEVHKWFEENDELEDYEAFDDDYDDDLNDLNWARANNISEDSLAQLKEKWEELRDIDHNAISWLELKDWTEKYGYDETLSQLESEINESFDNDYEEEFNDSEPEDELDKNDSKEDKIPNELKNWIERNKDVMDVDIETPSGDDTIYFKTKNKNTGEETQYSWNERTGITDHTNSKHFGSLDSEQNTSIEKEWQSFDKDNKMNENFNPFKVGYQKAKESWDEAIKKYGDILDPRLKKIPEWLEKNKKSFKE